MNESNDAAGERTGREQDGDAPESDHRLTRRGFLTTGLAAGGLALGGSTPALAKSKVAEDCTGDMTQLDVENGTFVLINNDWSAPVADGVDQCVYRYDDGSFGWSWNRDGQGAGNGPNYPQICLGNKPWGDVATDTDLFPIQRGDVSEFEASLDFDVTVTEGDEWNLALEWWLTESMPQAGTDLGSEITHEIMLVCEWGSGHGHGTPIESSAFTDAYGNTIDYWAHYEDHGSGWSFHIFRVAANSCPSQVDLTAIQDYLDASVTDTYQPFDDGYWVNGVEIGDEYWEYTTGQTEGYQYDVTLNGATETSGSGGSSDTTAPAEPSNLSVTDTTTSEVSLGWDSVSDAAQYNVYVDGAYDHQTTSTSTTVGSLSSDTSYQFGVSAVDDAGNESTTATVTASTDADSTGGSVVHAINAGGNAYDASDGTSFAADDYYSGGNTASTSDPIANTEDDALYQTERWGDPVTYELPVADGTYDVELHFAEIYWDGAGQRVFDVSVEGTTVLSNLDVHDRVGHDTALVETVTGVDVSDGYLTVDMHASTDNAKLAAVRVLESSSSSTDDSTDTTAPAEPSNLTVTDTTTSDASLDWDAVSDAAHYNVYVDGGYDHQTTNTATTVSGLASDTSYQFGVSAVDDAGNESATATVTASTDAESTSDGGSTGGGLTVNDYDGDPAWSGTNDLGEWCGAGSFQNGGGEGEVVSGALRLEYDGGGWFQSYVSQDVSEYSALKLRVRGDSGGEETEFALELGDTGDVLANLTSDTIGTSFSTVSVNLADNGLPTDLGDVYLDFWSGDYAGGAVEIDEIWFE